LWSVRRRRLWGLGWGDRGDLPDLFDGGNEPIPAPRQGLNEAGITGGVSQGIPDPVYSRVHPVVGIHEGAVGPESLGDLLARDQFSWPLQQHEQYLEWLRVQLDPQSLAAKLSGCSVRLKRTEAITWGWPW